MSRQKRAPTTTDRYATPVKGGLLEELRDAGSRELARMADRLGNDRVRGLVGEAAARRDALVRFIEQRLAEIAAAQEAELREMRDRADWWRRLGRGGGGVALPDPTRWREAARGYRDAAEALCAGHLGRAVSLLERAVEADRAAFRSMPPQVEMEEARRRPVDGPPETVGVGAGEGCPRTEAPAVLQAADRIVRVCDTMDQVPMPQAMRRHEGWWAEEDEDEEEPGG